MDFERNDDQNAILEAVEQLLQQHAGPQRAIELAAKQAHDSQLDAALGDAGFLELARGEQTGPLEAAMLVEAVARAAGSVSVAADTLVAPGVCEASVPGPAALTEAGNLHPVRFAAVARSLLVLDGDVARLLPVEPGRVHPVRSSFGYPMGVVDAALLAETALAEGESLGPGSGERLRSWWRVALAVEAVGNMSAALDTTVGYLKERRQFGRAIGSFQAVQHRLAQCKIEVEGSRWLAYEAAWLGAPAEAAAAAAAHAIGAAAKVFHETHQLSGAIGFTREHDLHVWSMRLKALELELGGVSAHRRALAQARWLRPGAQGSAR